MVRWPRAIVLALAAVVIVGCSGTPNASEAGQSSAGPSPTIADPIAQRIRAASFGQDQIAATEEALAREGVATVPFANGVAGQPMVNVTGPNAPFDLLDEQVRAVALDAWSGAGISGEALDQLVATPAGAAPPSLLLAAYVTLGTTSDSTPGARTSAALVGPVDPALAASTTYPLLVLALFVADATRGSAGAEVPTAVLAASGTICSAVSGFVDNALSAVFNAVKTSSTGFFGTLWNVVVSIGQTVVQGLVKAITAPVVQVIQHVVGIVAIVVNIVSFLRPWTLKLAPDDAATRFSVGGESTITDPVRLSVDLGGADQWPPLLTDCAAAAGITLPNLLPEGAPVDWRTRDFPDPAFPIQPLETLNPASTLKDVLGANSATTLRLDTGHEDKDDGTPHTGTVRISATVHRPGLDTLKQTVTNLVVSGLPGFIQDILTSIIGPPIASVVGKLDALTNESATTGFSVTYHEPKPSPEPSLATPQPTASSCSGGGAVAAGSYAGTVSYTVHFENSVGNVHSVSDVNGSGPIQLRVAANGAVSGTWSFQEQGSTTATSGVGTTVAKVTGTVPDGPVGGTTASLTLGGSMTLTEVVSVNGVSGPPSTTTIPWPNGSGYALSGDCSGGASAVMTIPTAGATIRIDVTRSGP